MTALLDVIPELGFAPAMLALTALAGAAAWLASR